MKDKIKMLDYVKVVIFLLVTIIILLVTINIYNSNIKIDENSSIVKSTVNHVINGDEIYSYIKENDNSIIYISDEKQNNKELENEIVKIIKDRKLEEEIIYLDITNEVDKDKFFDNFNLNYGTEGILSYPAFIYFEDGKIEDLLIYELNSDNIEEFLDRNVIE